MKKSIYTSEYAALCAELRAARLRAGLSQRALAAHLDVAPSWVAKVEIGERRIDLIEFVRFIHACGTDASAAYDRLARRVGGAVMRHARKGGGQ